jgi:hypothetical protein
MRGRTQKELSEEDSAAAIAVLDEPDYDQAVIGLI